VKEELEQKPGKSLGDPFIEVVLVFPLVGIHATLGTPIACSIRDLKRISA